MVDKATKPAPSSNSTVGRRCNRPGHGDGRSRHPELVEEIRVVRRRQRQPTRTAPLWFLVEAKVPKARPQPTGAAGADLQPAWTKWTPVRSSPLPTPEATASRSATSTSRAPFDLRQPVPLFPRQARQWSRSTTSTATIFDRSPLRRDHASAGHVLQEGRRRKAKWGVVTVASRRWR